MVNTFQVNQKPINGDPQQPAGPTFEGVAIVFDQKVGVAFEGTAFTFEQDVQAQATHVSSFDIVFFQAVVEQRPESVAFVFNQWVVDDG